MISSVKCTEITTTQLTMKIYNFTPIYPITVHQLIISGGLGAKDAAVRFPCIIW